MNCHRATSERSSNGWVFSFLRVLTTLGDEYKDIIQLLAVALEKDPPLLESFDGSTDQYVAERIKNRVPHLSARKEVKGLRLTEDDARA